MNARHDASEEFSLEGQRAGNHSTKARGGDAARSVAMDKPSSAATRDNAFPDRIRGKYYVVANEAVKDGQDGEARLYADERGEYLAFKVTGDRLITRLAAAEVVHDMVSVAQHRQWEALHVRGSLEFRREVWLEAGARGIEVQGYQPNDLDRQALADRRDAWERAHIQSRDVEVRSAGRDERTDQFDTRASRGA
ncbi:LPD7 domain-containing protein [Bradyrhizobium ottawaense]|uniref:LPD7 domain-containing protein n=1 Tax=Bradyrhizobium ottawaense TaxID=931866 RepID=UPI0004159D05|nr:LPD7 domain-containing protein [Bradyrhizobium ottawaense]